MAAPSYGTAFVPNDPLYQYQWHLGDSASFGTNLSGAWAKGLTGKGVVIGIIDDGVERSHVDLVEHFREDLSKDFTTDTLLGTDFHGTAVAGVAAGVGGNGKGVTGAAPGAEIADLRLLGTDGDAAGAFLHESGVDADGKYIGEAAISVKNNSWGRSFPFVFVDTDRDELDAMGAASLNNVVFVFAAGNGRGMLDEQTNLFLANSAEPVISVAALAQDGKYASYSSFGSSVFVTAPSGDTGHENITTTDRSGNIGYNNGRSADNYADADYTNTFDGTSSASPLVAGIIALGKQATPAMDVRLAKHALASSSVIVDAGDVSVSSGGRGWVTNAAGYSFNTNYGFGMIDATGFVNAVIDSAYLTDRTVVSTNAQTVNSTVSTQTDKKFTISAGTNLQAIETVEVAINFVTGGESAPTADWKNTHIWLTSPGGTVSELLLFTDLEGEFTIGEIDWVFTANNFWGESAQGEWTLSMETRDGAVVEWEDFEVTINMGEVVNESAGMVISKDVKAHSINLDHDSTQMEIQAGKKFTVTDSVSVRGGTLTIKGELTEGSPNADAGFFKGSQVYVASGGQIVLTSTGKLTASRGILVEDGTFTNNSGTVNVLAGGVYVSNGTFSNSGAGLIDVADGLYVSEGTFSNLGTGTINVAAAGADWAAQLVESQATNNGTLNVDGSFLVWGGMLTNGGTVDAAAVLAVGGSGAVNSSKNLNLTGGIEVSEGTIEVTQPNGQIQAGGDILIGENGILKAPSKVGSGANVVLAGGTVEATTLEASGAVQYYGGNLSVDTVVGQLQLRGGVFSVAGLGQQGSLNVNGTMAIDSAAGFSVDVARSGGLLAGDSITASGNIELGGTLVCVEQAGLNATLGESFVFLESTGGTISGDFDQNMTMVTPTWYYDVQIASNQKTASAVVARDYNLPSISLTPNQRAVGEVFNGLLNGGEDPGSGFDYENQIYAKLDALPTVEALAAAYNSMMPVNAMTVGEDMVRQMRAQSGAMRSRATEARRGALQPGSVFTNFLFGDSYGFNYAAHPLIASTEYGYIPFDGPDLEQRFTVWVNGGGSYAKGRDSATNPGYDAYGYNGTLGFDYLFSPQALVGVLVGYSNTQSDSNLSGTENDNDSILGAVYAAGSTEGFFYSGMVGYGVDGYSFKRRVDLGGGAVSDYQAKPDGNSWMGYLEVGYEWHPEDWTFGPTLSLQYIRGEIDGYTETGTGAFGLTVDDQTFESLTSTLGWRVGKVVHWEAMTILPEVRVGWIHEFENSSHDITSMMSVPGAGKFTVKGANPTNNYANLGASVGMALSPNATMSLHYDCYVFLKDANPTHQASATFRLSF